MSARLRKNSDLLRVLQRANPKLRQAILAAIDNDTVRCLSECCYNIVNGNITLTPQQKRKLTRHKTAIRELANKKVALKRKRQLLVQRGGFPIAAVLTPLLSVAASLLADGITGRWTR